jgi:ferredoxin
MDRRNFLKSLGVGILAAAGGALTIRRSKASELMSESGKEFKGVLVDTTRCIGCRSCEEGCAQVHDLPIPDIADNSVFKEKRDTSTTQLTVVNRYKTEKGIIFVKRQCMHCGQPGCVAACLVKAMQKHVWAAGTAWSRAPSIYQSLNTIAGTLGSESAISAGKSGLPREESLPALRPVQRRHYSSGQRGSSSRNREGGSFVNLKNMSTIFTERMK